MTTRWIARLTKDHDAGIIALLEGQTRPSFIQMALAQSTIQHSRIVLLDCSSDVRAARLRGPRMQPELATPQMDAWAVYLRGQADALRLPVMDTSQRSVEEVADELVNHIDLLRAEIAD